MIIEAAFVTSAAGASDFPRGDLPEIALVGRSNVGKSTLINALTRQRIARTSAAPGKTRLANIYRVARGAAEPFYLVDLPGYGYARGGKASALEFEQLTFAYFGSGPARSAEASRSIVQGVRGLSGESGRNGARGFSRATGHRVISALLLVDARHPGLASDRAAWQWLQATVQRVAVVATKIDKLARGERIRALRELESVFEDSVLPVSAVTGEGLDELWKLIERLRHSNSPPPGSSRSPAAPGKAPRPPRKN